MIRPSDPSVFWRIIWQLQFKGSSRIMALTWCLQNLLARHEAYIADSERERRRMAGIIEKLEMDKLELEAQNAKTIEENRALLDQLEEMNNNVADSDRNIKTLSADLKSTEDELHRLGILASRSAALESQLQALDHEQNALQESLSLSKEENKTSVQRWQRAERTLLELEHQISRIEKESSEERERHVEIVGRLERRRAVERELDAAAGRLKGAAATTSLEKGTSSSNVVSHFVKDILLDNTNLQVGLVELRELLRASNEEAHTLRKLLLLHQPVYENDDGSIPSTLAIELNGEIEPRVVSQELHVHHHYHTMLEPSQRDKPPTHRRSKKRRALVSPSLFTPPKDRHHNLHSRLMRPKTPLTAAAILSHTSVTVPITNPASSPNRWSTTSNQTRSSFSPSSAPSSPQSLHKYNSIFDRAIQDHTMDSSRPTSPESADPGSPPLFGAGRTKGTPHSLRKSPRINQHEGRLRSFSAHPENPSITSHPTLQSTIEETDFDLDDMTDLDVTSARPSSSASNDGDHEGEAPTRVSKIRRSASHESILSITKPAIDPLDSRPSHLYLRNLHHPSASSPALSTTSALALALLSSTPSNRSLLALRATQAQTQLPPPSLGRKVGGWVWSRWGVSPLSGESAEERAPGVNQVGAVRGLARPADLPRRVMRSAVDEALLREALGE
ncbi:MAG: hypothetical protein M1829_006366 [Trizodia sp. TS-e1964]|nr:MAG: hypothetical protein M1829_006366 [Trizodia sp. TS-e1964]